MDKEKNSTEMISAEIRELISGIDKFISRKDAIVDSLKNLYLNGSNKN